MAVRMPTIGEEIGRTASPFVLPATDGKTYTLTDVAGDKGTVLVFICNHCPYVRAIVDRLVADANILMAEGVGFVAISSNDVRAFPEDSFDKMKAFAERNGFPFPYLYDESQAVARSYGAVCTPDFFGISSEGTVEYRGRLDQGRKDPPPPGSKRELIEAMRMIADTGKGPVDQIPSVGCSLKWRDDA